MTGSITTATVQLSRLAVGSGLLGSRAFSCQCGPLAFRVTDTLWAEPMKKKKKVDIALVVQKELKKKRRLEKEIRKLDKRGRTLKPVDEIEGYLNVLKTKDERYRRPVTHSDAETERRALLIKDWTRYRHQEHKTQTRMIATALQCQDRALQELRNISEELYQEAIQPRDDLFPLERQGPVRTPPIENYNAPDGDYIDTTKVFDK